MLADDDEVLSGGNFHGQPVAVALDALALATVGLASISERRLYRLLDAKQSNGLPPFLIEGSGLHSGIHARAVHRGVARLGVQVARAPGVGGLDPVLGGTGGPREHGDDRGAPCAGHRGERRAGRGDGDDGRGTSLDLRSPLEPAEGTRAARDAVRHVVPYLEVDREFRPDIDACLGAIRDGSVVAAVESAIGPLD